ncbi:MAG: hypothetical protein AAGB31_15870 [Bdellovibrio sp.]
MSETKADDLVDSWNNLESSNVGLTKREYFAAMAAQGGMAYPYSNNMPLEQIAKSAVCLADELIKVLNERSGDESSST